MVSNSGVVASFASVRGVLRLLHSTEAHGGHACA